MQARKQFHVSAQKRTFFDRKVLKYGYSRTVALGKVIPEEWRYVRITVIDKDKSIITLQITKLLGAEPLAPITETNQRHRENP